MNNPYRISLIGLLAILLTGCASSKQVVQIPNQALRLEDPAKARIYVMRPSLLGSAIKVTVTENDELVGKTASETYLCWERAPGEVSIRSRGGAGLKRIRPITFQAEAGHVYYILQRVDAVSGWRMELITDEERARKYLRECKLAKRAD
jgi:hypothetical protein